MIGSKVTISLWCNNKKIEKELLKGEFSEIDFVGQIHLQKPDYYCIFLDLENNLEGFTQEIVSQYLKATEENKKVAVVYLQNTAKGEEKRHQVDSLLSEIGKPNPLYRVIACQDLYFFTDQTTKTSLELFINQSQEKKEVDVTIKGNYSYYPIHYQDLAEVIKKSLFLSGTNGEYFYLQGEKITDLDLAYLLKKYLLEYQNQELDINSKVNDLNTKNDFHRETIHTLNTLNVSLKQDFTENLKKYIQLTIEKNNLEAESGSDTQRKQKISFFKKLKKILPLKTDSEERDLKKELYKSLETSIEKIFFAVSLVYFATTLFFLASSYFSLTSMEKTLFYLKKGDIAMVSKKNEESALFQSISEANYGVISPIVRFASPDSNEVINNFLSFLQYSQNATSDVIKTYNLVDELYKSINNPQKNNNFSTLSAALKTNLQQVYESINQLEILLNNGQLPKPLVQKIKQNVEYQDLKKTQSQIGELIKAVDLVPSLYGDKKVENLFFLVQNNHEQRSTGGVIEYVYQINLEKGRVVFQKTYLPQEIDKLDSFTLLPPPLVEKLTGEPVWHLRDMNYNPDFPQTATNISWYLEKKLKVKPSFIITLNTSTLEEILKQKNQTSTILSKIGYEEYKVLLQKGEASVVTREIVENLSSSIQNHTISLPELLNISGGIFLSNKVNIWSSDNYLEKEIARESYSGSLANRECHPSMSSSRECIANTMHLNFSNFSLIPLNDYLKKNYLHQVLPGVLSVDHKLTVEYVYQKSTPLINRRLSEIVQLYIPSNSFLEEIKINDQILDINSFQKQEDLGLDRYQFILSTELNSSQNLSIKYTVPLLERTILPVAYSLADIKQVASNIGDSILEISIPDKARVSAVTSEITNTPEKIIFKQPNETSNFGLNFVPKQL